VWRLKKYACLAYGLGATGDSHMKGMVEERMDRGALSGASGRIIRRKTYAMPTANSLFCAAPRK